MHRRPTSAIVQLVATQHNDDSQIEDAQRPARESVRLHRFYRGKMETVPKCPVRSMEDFSLWYSPGVAAPCEEIAADSRKAYDYTWKWNTIAVVSDGTRVLGLGDIGPEAAMPVMEGKALLYRYLGGVDAVPICLDTRDPDELIRTVELIQPSFGGINLEDISHPKCFRILDTLRSRARIPVWHDDQQGTATATLAGLINALKVVEKERSSVRVAFVGAGAANVACARLLFAWGVRPELALVVDSRGILGTHREDLKARRNEFPEKWELAVSTNPEQRTGGIAEALDGADVVISLAKPGPGTILPEWISSMAERAIVFSCANPTPEIWPWEAKEAGAEIVATGRSDFPNQVNNSLVFPGVFRGALDVRASTITDSMCFAAANAIADRVGEALGPNRIIPTMAEWEVVPHVAAAVGVQAQADGVSGSARTYTELHEHAQTIIARSREISRTMLESGQIPDPAAAPEDRGGG